MASMSCSNLPDQTATSTASPSWYQYVPPPKPPVIPTFDPWSHFPDDTVNSAADIPSWVDAHKSDPKAKAKIDHFERSVKEIFKLLHLRNRQILEFWNNEFELQERKLKSEKIRWEMWIEFLSKDRPSKELVHTSPDNDAHVTSNTTTARPLATGKEAPQENSNKGAMGRPGPSDIAVVKPDAE